MKEENKKFVDYLIRITKDNRGVLAELRKGLGREPWTEVALFPYVALFTNKDTFPSREKSLYMIAALFASHPMNKEDGNMGDSLSALKRRKMAEISEGSGGDGIERRFVQLLKTDFDNLPIILRQQINLLKSNNIPVNWGQLLEDLQAWNHPDGYVQRNWAKSFWSDYKENTQEQEKEKEL